MQILINAKTNFYTVKEAFTTSKSNFKMNDLEKILAIINVSFSNENTLVLDLSNKRSIQIPLGEFPDIASINARQREDFQIIDDEYLSFLEIDEIYSLKYLIGYKNQ